VNPSRSHPEVVAAVARRLALAGVPSPDADARWLVAHVVEVAGTPTGCGAALLDGLVARRAAREPLQLVLGSWPFRTVELRCRPGVFVPRPETEVVAGVAIDAARAAGPRPTIVEPCTGTGAIACSLLAEVPGATIMATDLDPAAVELATENLARVAEGAAGPASAAPGARATVVAGDLLDPVDPALRGHLDVLVANPPYLPARDRGSWEVEVADHDPDAALVGGPDGHEVVDAVLAAAVAWLAPSGSVVVEIDERRGEEALAVAGRVGLLDARLVHDLTGAARAVLARAPGKPS
jgi:release factor glutamine methyltransferase